MSQLVSRPRMWLNARFFNAGTSYCSNSLSDGEFPRSIPSKNPNLICKSVNRLRGWPRNLIIRGGHNFCAPRSAVLLRSKRCELYHTRIKVHQKGLEPAIVSTKGLSKSSDTLTSRMPRPVFLPPSPFRCSRRGSHKRFRPPQEPLGEP